MSVDGFPGFTAPRHCFARSVDRQPLVIVIPAVYPEVIIDDRAAMPAEPIHLLKAGEKPIAAATGGSNQQRGLP